MRDISRKIKTLRTATAQAVLVVSPETIDLIRNNGVPKGDPLPIAKVAAIQAAKNTSQLIPYCHPLLIDHVGVDFTLETHRILIDTSVTVIHKTGVEMEAMAAASAAALTLYDMLKMVDEAMEIQSVRLTGKMGGKSDFRDNRAGKVLKAAVVVMSDSISAGHKSDTSGKAIVARLEALNVEVVDCRVIPDEADTIEQTLIDFSDNQHLDLLLTTGGTGMSPRDVTPEVMDRILDREIPGMSEAARSYGQERTPYAMLSRAKAGVRGNTLIINLPGSRKGVEETLDALFPAALHAFKMMAAEGHKETTTV